MKDSGANKPKPYKIKPTTINGKNDLHFAITPTDSSFSSEGAAGASVCGGAFLEDSSGSGGGQVILPLSITVAPRMTSSSIFTTSSPFFSGQSSVSKCRKFVP